MNSELQHMLPARISLVSTSLLIVFVLASSVANADIAVGQFDDFQDGTVHGWIEGFSSPNPPTNVSTGGPAGPGDAYLENVSSGIGGAGGKLIMFNQLQWTGNYVAAGVTGITMDIGNFGQSSLPMRVALRGGPNSGWYSSFLANDVPADGIWRQFTFDLSSAALSLVSGSDSWSDVLSNVVEVRILASEAPASNGDTLAAQAGFDNITAVPEPSVAVALLCSTLCFFGCRARNRGFGS